MKYFEDLTDDYVEPQPIGYITQQDFNNMQEASEHDSDEEVWMTSRHEFSDGELLIPVYAEPIDESIAKSFYYKKYGELLKVPELPSIKFMRNIVKAFLDLEGNICGAGLHIVVDDHNVEDEHIKWCISNDRNTEDAGEYSDRYTPDVKWLGRMLLQYSYADRLKIVKTREEA